MIQGGVVVKGIKSIIYEMDGHAFVININEKSEVIYRDVLGVVGKECILEYLRNFFGIIDSWDNEYINMQEIDGSKWILSIIYSNGNVKEYSGRASYPNNFEAFERLNLNLIKEVQYGKFEY